MCLSYDRVDNLLVLCYYSLKEFKEVIMFSFLKKKPKNEEVLRKMDGREIKYAKHIVKTCIKVIAMPADGKYYMNDLWNQWAGISGLLRNLKRF